MTDNSLQPNRRVEHRVDIGAQVGIQRNIEFASGGRVHRFSPDPYRTWRPLLSLRVGAIQVGGPGASASYS